MWLSVFYLKQLFVIYPTSTRKCARETNLQKRPLRRLWKIMRESSFHRPITDLSSSYHCPVTDLSSLSHRLLMRACLSRLILMTVYLYVPPSKGSIKTIWVKNLFKYCIFELGPTHSLITTGHIFYLKTRPWIQGLLVPKNGGFLKNWRKKNKKTKNKKQE